MHVSRILLLNLLFITPLCYATRIHKLNRRLMQFGDKSGTVQDYRYLANEAADEITVDGIHLVSECKLHKNTIGRRTECHVTDIDGNIIWSLNIDNDNLQNTPWQAMWHDATGEHIALRHPSIEPYQGVYRVSFLSTLKSLNLIQRAFLYDALKHHKQRGTGYPIVYESEYAKYRKLPTELRIPALFNLSFSSTLCMGIDDCIDTIGASYSAVTALVRKLSCCQRQQRIPF